MESRLSVAHFYLRSDSMPKPCPSCPSSWLRASAVSGTCPLPLVACASSETLPGCSPVLCVCCVSVSGTRVWVTRSPDVTQGMPAVEGDDCRGQVGLRTQDWGSPWGWKQGGPLCWGGAVAPFTPCFSQLKATACQWGSWGTGQPSVRGLCTVHSGMSGA